jgi:hypothetical protein
MNLDDQDNKKDGRRDGRDGRVIKISLWEADNADWAKGYRYRANAKKLLNL